MPDNEKQLNIKVVTTATGEGAKQTADELSRLADTSKEASHATEKLGEAHEEAGHKAEGLTEKHRSMRGIFRLIGEETAPQMGEALHAALEGPYGAALALGLALSLVAEMIEQAEENIRKLEEAEAELKTDTWKKQMDAANQAAVAANHYLETLTQIATETDKVKQAEDLELVVLKAKQEAQTQILQAQEKSELAAAAGDKGKEASIRARYEDVLRNKSVSDESQTLETKDIQRANRMIDAHRLRSVSDAAESAYESGLGDKSGAGALAELDQATAKQSELDKAAGKYNLAKLRESLTTADTSASAGGASEADVIQMQINEGEKAKKTADENRAKVAELNAAVESHKQSVEKLKAAADKAEKEYQDNAQAINSLNQELKSGTAVLGIHKQTSRTVSQIEHPPGSEFSGALSGESADAANVLMGHAESVDAQHQKVMTDIGALLAGHAVSLKESARLITNALSSQQTFNAALAAMEHTANAMRTYSIQTIARLNQITKDIETAGRQISTAGSRLGQGY